MPSFQEIKSDVIDIDVDLANALDYKELRGIAIMERYFKKGKEKFERLQI